MLEVMLTLMPIFAIMFLGAFAEYKRILHQNTASIINQFVYYFSLPILLFHIMAQVDIDNISWRPVLGFLLGLSLSQAIITIISRMSGKNPYESTMGGLLACFPNAAFMGLPIVMLTLPSNMDAEIYAGIAVLLPTISIVYTDTFLSLQHSKKQSLPATIRHILKIITHSPQMLGAGLGLIVSLSGIALPEAITVAAKMLGSTAAPCSLFCIGMTLAAQIIQWKQSVPNDTKQKKAWFLPSIIIGTKLLFCPLLVLLFCNLFGASQVATAAVTIIASMPTAIICYVIAERHNVFVQEGIMVIVLGTILSCLSIPFIISSL